MHTTPVRTYALTMVVVQLHDVGQSYHFVSWVSLQRVLCFIQGVTVSGSSCAHHIVTNFHIKDINQGGSLLLAFEFGQGSFVSIVRLFIPHMFLLIPFVLMLMQKVTKKALFLATKTKN